MQRNSGLDQGQGGKGRLGVALSHRVAPGGGVWAHCLRDLSWGGARHPFSGDGTTQQVLLCLGLGDTAGAEVALLSTRVITGESAELQSGTGAVGPRGRRRSPSPEKAGTEEHSVWVTPGGWLQAKKEQGNANDLRLMGKQSMGTRATG